MNNKSKEESIDEKILNSTRVEVHVPSVIEIILVQANEFKHYEISVWLASLFFSAATGFWTAYITTNPKSSILMWTSLTFTLFAIVFITISIFYRMKLQGGKIKRVGLLDNFK